MIALVSAPLRLGATRIAPDCSGGVSRAASPSPPGMVGSIGAWRPPIRLGVSSIGFSGSGAASVVGSVATRLRSVPYHQASQSAYRTRRSRLGARVCVLSAAAVVAFAGEIGRHTERCFFSDEDELHSRRSCALRERGALLLDPLSELVAVETPNGRRAQ